MEPSIARDVFAYCSEKPRRLCGRFADERDPRVRVLAEGE